MLRRYTRLSGSCQHWDLGLSMAAVFQSQPLPWRASGFTLQARHFFFGLGNRAIGADARVDSALSVPARAAQAGLRPTLHAFSAKMVLHLAARRAPSWRSRFWWTVETRA
jgi:hypothetical protein